MQRTRKAARFSQVETFKSSQASWLVGWRMGEAGASLMGSSPQAIQGLRKEHSTAALETTLGI